MERSITHRFPDKAAMDLSFISSILPGLPISQPGITSQKSVPLSLATFDEAKKTLEVVRLPGGRTLVVREDEPNQWHSHTNGLT
jgi:hypothetical protein